MTEHHCCSTPLNENKTRESGFILVLQEPYQRFYFWRNRWRRFGLVIPSSVHNSVQHSGQNFPDKVLFAAIKFKHQIATGEEGVLEMGNRCDNVVVSCPQSQFFVNVLRLPEKLLYLILGVFQLAT